MEPNHSPRPRLDALERRRPPGKASWRRAFIINGESSPAFRAFACSFPHVFGVIAVILGFFSGAVFLMVPSPWSWVTSAALLILSMGFARGFAHARFLGPVLDEQAAKMHAWFSQSSRLTDAASRWASADSVWCQADYHRVRLAYREDCQLSGKSISRWQMDLFGFSSLPRVLRFFERYLPLEWHDPGRIDVPQDQEAGEDWLAQTRALPFVDAGKYSPREVAHLNRCVSRYKNRSRELEEAGDVLSERVQAWARWSQESGLREGAAWWVAPLPLFFVHALAGYMSLFFGALIATPIVVGVEWVIVDALGASTSLTIVIQWVRGLVASHPAVFWTILGLLPLIGAGLVQIRRCVRHLIATRKGSTVSLGVAWGALPISRFARQRLEEMIQENPRVAAWFFAHVGQELRQVEFRFARELWHAMAAVDSRDAAHLETEKAREAIKGLPATAAYEARLLAEQMQGELPEAPEGPDLPRRSRL